jgi:ankyrin repeat protein
MFAVHTEEAEDIIPMLLEAGVDPDVKNNMGLTALDLAMQQDKLNERAIELLKEVIKTEGEEGSQL